MAEKKVTVSFPFLSLLALIFITLKLTEVITWSWLWVLSPLWLPVALVLGVVAIIGVVWGVVSFTKFLARN